MIKKWINWINLSLAGMIVLMLIGAAIVQFSRTDEITYKTPEAIKMALPKGAFSQSKDAYNSIGEPILALKHAPPTLQIPDLRSVLLYYGKNGRPDADAEHTLLHFTVISTKLPVSVPPGKKLYLIYDKKQVPPRYLFSPDNAPTSLWIEGTSRGNDAIVKVRMQNEQGELITTPENNAEFSLPEKEYIRFGGTPWEIGKWRVDGTLLARQKARWYGRDMFMDKHGGPEYSQYQDKQRVDFGEGEEAYSVYIGINDPLVWENERWKGVKPGPDSLGRPLLMVKKVDERLLSFELWDVEGKGKVVLNLLKSTEGNPVQSLEKTFKFVGARTRSQFVFEVNKEKILLSPQDWLLQVPEGWKKLTSPQEIDDYVNRKTIGPLFVFDGVERRDDRQYIVGTLFNASRTDAQAIELAVQQGGNNQPGEQKMEASKPEAKPPLKEQRPAQPGDPTQIRQTADSMIRKVMHNK